MEEKLIASVKRYKFLYDKSQPSYKNIELKDRTWSSIAKDLQRDVEEIRKRWKTLRDRYLRERKKLAVKSGSAAKSSKSKWKYFGKLAFLADISDISFRTSIKYEDPIVEEVSTSSFCDNVPSEVEINNDGTILFDENFQKSPDTRRRRNFKSEVLVQNNHKEMQELLKSARSSLEVSSGKTPVQVFFSSLAGDIEESGMPFHQRSALQIKVMSLVHDEIKKVVPADEYWQ